MPFPTRFYGRTSLLSRSLELSLEKATFFLRERSKTALLNYTRPYSSTIVLYVTLPKPNSSNRILVSVFLNDLPKPAQYVSFRFYNHL